MSVLVINHVSLDGVMQGPGRPDEDTRDGFTHGGWAEPASDQAMAEAMGRAMSRPFSWLFGRRSYQDMLSPPMSVAIEVVSSFTLTLTGESAAGHRIFASQLVSAQILCHLSCQQADAMANAVFPCYRLRDQAGGAPLG